MMRFSIVRWLFVAPALCVGLGAVGCSHASHQHDRDTGHRDHGGVHHRFDDAEGWASRFEQPGRDDWQRPDHVLEVLNLAPDAKVADIGSATGYFPVRFAKAVPRGQVFGLDVEPNMVAYLNDRAAREGLTNLRSILAEPDDPKIPEPVDLIFICNTYHHLVDRPSYFRARRSDLRPRGRLAIVDFRPGELPIGPAPGHKIPPDAVHEELQAAGYRLIKTDDSLEYQFFHIYGQASEQ